MKKLLLLLLLCGPVFAYSSNAQDEEPVKEEKKGEPAREKPEKEEPKEEEAKDDVRNSVVKIHTTHRRPSFYRPWTKEQPSDSSGSGAVISGNRILTNAHVVMHAKQVYVQPYQSADKLPAEVLAIAPGIDLAVLKLDDEAFFNDHKPLEFATALPKIKDTVNAYGFPTGGSELSVTEGIVSRIEFVPYGYEALGLRIQVDAALNPGNSGGPVISADKMVGLVFSGIREADNIGYLIPTEEVQAFLKDIEDKEYDGRPRMFASFQTLENKALRDKLGLTDEQTGVVFNATNDDEKKFPLQIWDVLSHIGENKIQNDGKVRIGTDLRLSFEYFVPRLAKDGEIELTIIRKGETRKVQLPVKAHTQRVIPYLGNSHPRYFIYGPLVFSPATQEFANGLGSNWLAYLVPLKSPLALRRNTPPQFEGEEIVVVPSKFFPHKMTKGYDSPFGATIHMVNGTKIKNLKHLVEVLAKTTEEFITIEFNEVGMERLVFRQKEFHDSTEEILNDSSIRYQGSKEARKLWNSLMGTDEDE